MEHAAVQRLPRMPGTVCRALPPSSVCRTASMHRVPPLRRRHHYSPTAQSRFFNIQIQASWGNGQGSSSGGEAYADSQPKWGGFLNSSSSSGKDEGSSPVTRLLSAAVAHVRAAPLPGAAAPWLVLPLLPVVMWCVGWVFTTGLFTLAHTCMSGMCSVAMLLHPTIPLRGASYEDIAVSLVKALQSGTDAPSTWVRPGLLVPSWLLRWLMGTLYALATAGTGLAGSLIHSRELLAVTAVSKALLYASCLLFMLPLGSGLNSMASTFMQRLQEPPAPNSQQQPGSSSGSSSGGSSAGSSGGYSSSSGGYGAAGSGSGKGLALPKLSDTSALALKLAGVLAWPCISAAAVLQPSLLLQANSPTSHLGVSAPQVLVCACLLSLLLTLAVAAARFGWDVVRRQAVDETVVDFGLQLGLLCGVQAVLNVSQLGLCLVSRQVDFMQLGMPVLSTLILCRIAYSTWRLYRIGANAPSVWLQVLTLTPSMAGAGSNGGSGSSSGYSR